MGGRIDGSGGDLQGAAGELRSGGDFGDLFAIDGAVLSAGYDYRDREECRAGGGQRFCRRLGTVVFLDRAVRRRRLPIGSGPTANTAGPLAVNATRTFSRTWTPGVSDSLPISKHSCFWGIVSAACDTNKGNNERNRNSRYHWRQSELQLQSASPDEL